MTLDMGNIGLLLFLFITGAVRAAGLLLLFLKVLCKFGSFLSYLLNVTVMLELLQVSYSLSRTACERDTHASVRYVERLHAIRVSSIGEGEELSPGHKATRGADKTTLLLTYCHKHSVFHTGVFIRLCLVSHHTPCNTEDTKIPQSKKAPSSNSREYLICTTIQVP